MNKYVKYYDDTEIRSHEKEIKILNIIMSNLKEKMFDYLDFNTFLIVNDYSNYSLLYYFMENLSIMHPELQKYFINNVIGYLNNKCLLNEYLILICECKTKKDYAKMKRFMDSLNLSGIVKNIKFNSEKNNFILTLKNNKTIKFSDKLENVEQIKEARNHCHTITQQVIEENCDDEILYAVTVYTKNLVNEKRYHSFILCNDIVNDFAHNIVISFEDYKKLYNPTIILYIEGKTLLNNLEKLKYKDKEFKDSKVYLINYVMHKQMKKDKKRKKTN